MQGIDLIDEYMTNDCPRDLSNTWIIAHPSHFLLVVGTFTPVLWDNYTWPLLCWGTFYVYSVDWEIFLSQKYIEFCQMLFLHMVTIWFLSFILLAWYIKLILQMLKQPCILEVNSTWSWCIILLMYCWLWIANILLRIFVPVFIRHIGL